MAGTYALTDVSTVKSALKLMADDTVLDRLIDVATAQIERYCDRQFKTRSYTSWLDGKSGTLLYLPNYPVTAVSRVCTTLRDLFSITNTTANAAYATVAASTSTLTLTLQVGATTTTNALTYATYTTINSLVAAINAAGNGWSATESDTGTSIPSTDIKPGGAWGCLDDSIYIYGPDEPSEQIEWDEDSGRLWSVDSFSKGRQNIFVAYTGGYSTTPDDVEQACIELIQKMYQEIKHNDNLQSETLGDYSWAARTQIEIDGKLATKLYPFKRITLPGE